MVTLVTKRSIEYRLHFIKLTRVCDCEWAAVCLVGLCARLGSHVLAYAPKKAAVFGVTSKEGQRRPGAYGGGSTTFQDLNLSRAAAESKEFGDFL